MILASPVFVNNARVPAKYTCDGEDINPPLLISEVPANAQSLVLIMDDPDSPTGTWVHWTLWNIDPRIKEIGENSVPQGAMEGVTTFGSVGYGGPCPHSGTHHYVFKLYALDAEIDLLPQADKAKLLESIQSHIIAEAQLVGVFSR